MKRLLPLAPPLNAYRCGFELQALLPLQTLYLQKVAPFFAEPRHQPLLQGGQIIRRRLRPGFFLFSYDSAPLLWASADNAAHFQLFQAFYQQLALEADLQELLDIRTQSVMYAGFFVVGNRAPEPLWHFDYQPGANGLTLITPLFEPLPEHGALLYEDAQQQLQTYAYRLGEALIFGEGFLHSTAPYPPSEHLRVLLSLTFGTDQLKYWPLLKQAVASQSKYYHLPCGHLRGSCLCLWQAPFKKLMMGPKQIKKDEP